MITAVALAWARERRRGEDGESYGVSSSPPPPPDARYGRGVLTTRRCGPSPRSRDRVVLTSRIAPIGPRRASSRSASRWALRRDDSATTGASKRRGPRRSLSAARGEGEREDEKRYASGRHRRRGGGYELGMEATARPCPLFRAPHTSHESTRRRERTGRPSFDGVGGVMLAIGLLAFGAGTGRSPRCDRAVRRGWTLVVPDPCTDGAPPPLPRWGWP